MLFLAYLYFCDAVEQLGEVWKLWLESAKDPLLDLVDVMESNWRLVRDVLQRTRHVLPRLFVRLFPKKEGQDWWRIDYTSLGTPRGRYDEHSSKSSLSCETKVYWTSRTKPNFRRWCLLASCQLQTIYKVPHPGLCFSPAATWNLHTTQPRTLLPTFDEVVNLTGLL
jgi:hypothetical protein